MAVLAVLMLGVFNGGLIFMEQCESCLLSRPIISENGIHYNCTLGPKDSIVCITHDYIKYVKSPSISKED